MVLFPFYLYLVLSRDDLSVFACLTHAIKLIRGNILRIIYINVSFIGMLVLCVLSLGIGLLWVEPYYEQTFANLFLDATGELPAVDCAVNAANDVPELRRRICGDRVVEYDRCISSHTVALPDDTYCYCELDCAKPLEEFLPYAAAEVARAKANPAMDDGEDPNRLYFVSSLPWLSFASIRLPKPVPADSNPRITFGKFFAQGDRVLLPVDLTVNHALADGIHLARFFEGFERRADAL